MSFSSDVVLLPALALSMETALLAAIDAVTAIAPFRHLSTRRGLRLSVAMSNCGQYGWTSDARGYRYETTDPLTQQPWPALPEPFSNLATQAAQQAGFDAFTPDACLINRYAVGARMGLHQDKDEEDFNQPIVSVSLGLPAIFLFGGPARTDKTQKIALNHGDVLVWGRQARLFYHGVLPLKAGEHPCTGPYRYNLTLRRARGV